MVVDENDGSDQSAIFTATISYPLNRTFTLPLEKISSNTMVCAACLNSDLSRLTGTGRVYLTFGGLLSGGIDQMILSGTDDAGTDTKVSGSFLFADAELDTAAALSSDVTFNLDFEKATWVSMVHWRSGSPQTKQLLALPSVWPMTTSHALAVLFFTSVRVSRSPRLFNPVSTCAIRGQTCWYCCRSAL